MYHSNFRFDVLDIVVLKHDTRSEIRNQLEIIADSEARIFLLFASRDQSREIMAAGRDLGITGKNYVWIASQSVVGPSLGTKPEGLPRGMLGKYICLNFVINFVISKIFI